MAADYRKLRHSLPVGMSIQKIRVHMHNRQICSAGKAGEFGELPVEGTKCKGQEGICKCKIYITFLHYYINLPLFNLVILSIYSEL